MLNVSDISLTFTDRKLFDGVNIKFTPGNCYGLIGANGAGKSTFLKILAGDLQPTTGTVSLDTHERLSVLRQNHYDYEEQSPLAVVMMGNEELHKISEEKDAIYMNPDATDDDFMHAAELEAQFGEMGGYEAEAEAAQLLQNLGIAVDLHHDLMSNLTSGEHVKVLLAKALFGKPDVLLLDEPTNGLDIQAIQWLEEFLINFENTVIVVSHDRHFLNKVCTHMADLDYGKIKLYVGNYDFWKESSELALRLQQDANRKSEEKVKELQDFIARF
ncbi:MAG: ATP-binding cassette domain-containing protein, partial [Streptococcaceae bacterium]|nr:ATP-binding cassette domain-containing protein [Streptococcaceae bacterium]